MFDDSYDKKAFSEIIEILNHTDKQLVEKLPSNFINFLFENMDKEYEVEINSKNLDITLTLENDVIESNVKIIKYYGSKEDLNLGTLKKEKDITFEFYNENGDLVYSGATDELGELNLVLPYGKYNVKQITTTENYEKVSDFSITIDEESDEIIEFELHDLEIEVPNAYIEDEKSNIYDYIIMIIMNLFLGAVMFVYDF